MIYLRTLIASTLWDVSARRLSRDHADYRARLAEAGRRLNEEAAQDMEGADR